MQRLILLMFVGVTLVPFLAYGDGLQQGKILPAAAALMPEVLSMVALVAVLALGVRDGFSRVRAAYWIVFVSFMLMIACGALVNHVASGPILAGLRLYLRAVPWFFVPAVAGFSAIQLRTQLHWLLGLSLLQVPIAIEQRIVTGRNVMGFYTVTGDWTTGTIGDSGVLSIFLIGGICILAGLYSCRQLPVRHFIPLLLLLLVPTTINETKATFVLLPIGLMATLLASAPPGRRLHRFVVGLAAVVVCGAIFVPVYDWMNEGREDSKPLLEFFSSEEEVQAYVGGNRPADEVVMPGRVEALALPLSRLSEDAISLVFGYGIGNASTSNAGQRFAGLYAYEYVNYMQSAAARVLLEQGLSGLLFMGIIGWLILRDSIHVARGAADTASGVAAGWIGVMVFIMPAMAYSQLESSAPISYLFCYFSGLVAAERMRQPHAQK